MMTVCPGADTEQAQGATTREALYSLVWSESMLKVAARFGVSSSYMARVCTLLNVPRPERGYWAKLAFGKGPAIPPLPDARPGDELVWSVDGSGTKVAGPLPRPPITAPRKRRIRVASQPDVHLLVRGAKELFEAGRLSYEAGYLKPAKWLLVDLAVTKTGLDKALSFANSLFSTLETNGYRVVIASHGERLRREEVDVREEAKEARRHNNLWSPGRCTVVYIGTVAIGLTIIEMSEEVEARYVKGEYVRVRDFVPPKRRRYAVDHIWTTKKLFPTGRLCLQAYSPYWRAKWLHIWRETKGQDLVSRIPSIVKAFERAVAEIARLVEEGEREAELERQRQDAEREQWRQEEAERRSAKALTDSRDELLRIIDDWAQSMKLEQFFEHAERKTTALGEGERQKMLERLKLARELAGSGDALEWLKDWKAPHER